MARLLLVTILLGTWAAAQVDQLPQNGASPPQSQVPPRSDERGAASEESSSRDTRIDISPPADDAKKHPNSFPETTPDQPSDVQELHPWNPHKALKDIEVGDFYFKRKNYRAALDRYQEALVYKPSDAIANFRIGECMEKLDNPSEAVAHYQEYLKILPHGPLSKEAEKAIQKLGTEKSQTSRNTLKP